MVDLVCFKALLSFFQKAAPSMEIYRSVPGRTTQTSIALIFRCSESAEELEAAALSGPLGSMEFQSALRKDDLSYDIELISANNRLLANAFEVAQKKTRASVTTDLLDVLLIQRARREGDPHSGQIAYPGGKNDGDETDFETVVREVWEEVGLDLKDHGSFLFLGKVPRNFFAYYRKETAWMVSVHVFFMKRSTAAQAVLISKDEVEKLFWCPLSTFLAFENKNIFHQQTSKRPSDVFSNHRLKKMYFDFALSRCFESCKFSCFRLESGDIFYGLSFQILLHVLKIIAVEAKKSGETGNRNAARLLELVDFGFKFELLVRRSPLSWVHYRILNDTYQKQRLQQFIEPYG